MTPTTNSFDSQANNVGEDVGEVLGQGATGGPKVTGGGGGDTSPPNFIKKSQDLSIVSLNESQVEAETGRVPTSDEKLVHIEQETVVAAEVVAEGPRVGEGGVVEIVGGEVKVPTFVPQHPTDYPRNYEQNLDFRLKLAVKCAKDEDARALLYQLCKDDILFWVNTFCMTYNPRKTPSTIPFITYEYEDKLIRDLVEKVRKQEDILIDKSRDMGVTWCVLLVYTWFWQFGGEGNDFLVGSRKEQYIDVMGNMDTLLEKVRFLIRNQPKWMRPKGFDFKTHSNYLKIVNPDSKSTITGEATNNNFSRGGRRRSIFMDEFAFWECDEAAWRASADSTNCRIVVSTPFGLNNKFAELRHGGHIDVRSLHWRLHPEKDQAWYDAECKRRNHDKVEIAQELDINYEGSDVGVLFPFDELRSAMHNQPSLSAERRVVSLDPAGEGEDEAVFYVMNNGNVVQSKFLAKSKPMELAAEAVSLITKHKAQVFVCDAIGNDVIEIVANLLGKNERNVKLVAFKSSEQATDKVKYFNKRAEAYHEASVQLKSGNVKMDEDQKLMRQLNATKYLTKNGRIQILLKEEIKELLGTSPDRADAFVMAVWALRFTYSYQEVKQAAPFRGKFDEDEVLSGTEYGDWGDVL